MSEIKPCKHCGANIHEVLAHKRPFYRKARDFCSVACTRAHHKEHGHPNQTLSPRPCSECGTLFQPVNRSVRMCSMECKNQHHRRAMAGKNNPNYRHGEQVDVHRRRFRRMTSPMLRMACPTCQECGVSEDLIVHHIDERQTNDTLENLIVLCRGCHTVFHKTHDPERRASMTSKWTAITASYAETLSPEQIREIRNTLI